MPKFDVSFKASTTIQVEAEDEEEAIAEAEGMADMEPADWEFQDITEVKE